MKKLTLMLMAVLACCMAHAADTLVTLPADAIVENWTLTCVEYDQSGNPTPATYNAKVATAGSAIYIQGLAVDDAWVAGTVGDGIATFAKRQYVGTYYSSDLYLAGYEGNGELIDIVFEYDADYGVLTTGSDVILVDADDNAWGQMGSVVLYRSSTHYNDDGTLEPPLGATITNWTLNCRNSNPADPTQFEEISEPVRVATSGADIYIQGLCPAEGWLKGVVDGSTATFPARQYLGESEGYKFYAIGYEGDDAIDIVFSYDAEAGMLSTQSNILMINENDEALMQLSSVYLYRVDKPVEEDLVELPEGLTPLSYVCSATSILLDADGAVAGTEPVQWPVKVAFDGDSEVYVQGICQFMPTAWIKGSVSDGEVTFASGQYLGRMVYPVYFCGQLAGDMTDAVFQLEDGVLTAGSYYVVVNSSKTSFAPFAVYAGLSIAPLQDVAATPATPAILDYQAFNAAEGYGSIALEVPVSDVDGNIILSEKLGYRLYTETAGVQAEYVFRAGIYANLTEDMTVVPYDFTDDYDFPVVGGGRIFLNDNLDSCDRIGVQSVYTGGGETRVSAIGWYSLNTLGIVSMGQAAAGASRCYDLQGRPASQGAHGLFICNGKKVVR